MSYSDFVNRLGNGETDIAKVIIKDDGNISVETKNGKLYSVYAPWFRYDVEKSINSSNMGLLSKANEVLIVHFG